MKYIRTSFILLTILLGVSIIVILFTSLRLSIVFAQSSQNELSISEVSPNQSYNWQKISITITGTNFVPTPAVILGNISLDNVTFVSEEMIVADISPDLPTGIYSLSVINPDNETAQLPDSFTVYPGGDGSLSTWITSTDMIGNLYRQNAFSYMNHLYAIGTSIPQPGHSRFDERAAIISDGQLAQWEVINPSGNTAGGGSNSIRVGNHVYSIGGHFEHAVIYENGTISEWESMPEVNDYRSNPALVASKNYLYVIGGYSTDVGLSTVERLEIMEDGSLGEWEYTTSMNSPRARPGATVVGNYIYAIGGHSAVGSGVVYDTVEMATINGDGSLSEWTYTSPLYNTEYSPAVVNSRGYIYAVDGCCIQKSKVYSDGSLGPWSYESNYLSQSRRYPSLAITGNSLYALGGFDGSASDENAIKTVEFTLMSQPSIEDVLPLMVSNFMTSTVWITGTNYLPSPSVWIYDIVLESNFVSTTTLSATIPKGLTTGWYTLTLTNPDGQIAKRDKSIYVFSNVYIPFVLSENH